MQSLLQLPAPDHYYCSSSAQAVALVMHHLYNVITALEIVTSQQGVQDLLPLFIIYYHCLLVI